MVNLIGWELKTTPEATEMIGTISSALGGCCQDGNLFLYVTANISKKIWKPFHEMLEKLRHFDDERQLPESIKCADK